ncbi:MULTISPECIES: AAA family ATPase [Rhizobium]|uniref:ATPase associated with various cellular activities AAA_3 n=1 Tax=Rhizobium leguminosarum bv. trifolii (strain WSM1325) TaxID=395491 RepID=C6AT41_RHILS|nr:MoxR family ATPase [Rhizobium leguminosarum]ACS57313.1 ATPase associated with various cellular activities AAA_3 [Rhizobium leguminosarum bv. trifolii WSM1325]MBY2905929.1 MoxR family ATPase [Rhizobium leguminosarum]MBY2912948.1 MoxR family ATPase [Rhizobium leguminosarum]MBY2945487.1 MoxR family ATPase [Rhizobium leguminosarum]MBY2968605.1 MoxR family ATPase [Rhizobium leguminosarum]
MGMMKTEASLDEKAIVAAAEKALSDIAAIRGEVSKVIFGQESVVENTILAVLSGGHALLVGVPGLAKTRLVTTLGEVLGLAANRIQFTPDLMPSDILGSEVMDQDDSGRRSFRFVKGPVFAQLLMADEINRASPRTQSALLQSMQEYHITIAGQRYDLPAPFHVLATQNPLEQEGTYPLPEAQLDRFLLQVDVNYPELAAERQILLETTGLGETRPEAVIDAQRLIEIQTLVRQMPVSDTVVDAILALVRSARPGQGNTSTDKNVAWGPGPRAGQAMMLCARARALYEGRLAPSLDDIFALAEPILQHRMALTFAARAEGMSVRDVVAGLVKQAKG